MADGSSASPRRRLVVYVCAVVGPTLVVLALGLQAIARQRDALAAQTLATGRLQEARIADQLERRVVEAAEAALGELADPAMLTVAASADPEQQARLWPRVRAMAERHPVVRQIYFSVGDTVVYPPAVPAVPQLLDSWLLEETGRGASAARAGFATASRFEDRSRWAQAARTYEAAARLPVSHRLQAMALARAARAHHRAGDLRAAARVYASLRTEHPDSYDLSGRPHALVASLTLSELGDPSDRRAALEEVRSDLAAGRWALHADSASYFLRELAGTVSTPADSAYLEALAFAQRVQTTQPRAPSARGGTTSFVRLTGAPGEHLAYRTAPLPGGQGEMTIGVSTNIDWIGGSLLAGVVRAIAPGGRAILTTEPDLGTRAGPALSGFSVLLTAQTVDPGAGRGVVALTLSTAAVLGLLLLGVVLLLRDVSRETDLNRLRADLVGAVSHDLRTPLSVMRVYAETLADTPDLPPEDRRRYANVIAQETERLALRISSAIDFTRIESGARSYRLETGLLQPLVRDVVESYRPFLERQGFAVDLSLDEDLPPVDLDREAVSQALLNLLDNAFKYSGSSRAIGVRLACDGATAVVDVQDGGPGLAPAERSRVLERFERGSRHPESGGYGLGLYLVANTMRAHHGSVTLLGAEPSGTIARLVFPLTGGEAT